MHHRMLWSCMRTRVSVPSGTTCGRMHACMHSGVLSASACRSMQFVRVQRVNKTTYSQLHASSHAMDMHACTLACVPSYTTCRRMHACVRTLMRTERFRMQEHAVCTCATREQDDLLLVSNCDGGNTPCGRVVCRPVRNATQHNGESQHN